MQSKKKLSDKIKMLSIAQKIQLILALLTTAVLLVSAPTAAWFNYQRQIVKIQKIQSPNTLILSAPHHEDRMYFKVEGINANEYQVDGNGNEIKVNEKPVEITHKDYVFCVVGEAVDKFTMQLAYTTNNPFTYEVYAAEELTSPGTITAGVEKDFVEYTPQNRNVPGLPLKFLSDPTVNSTLYYKIDTSINEGRNLISPAQEAHDDVPAQEAQYGGAPGQYVGTYLNRGTVAADGSYDALNTYHTVIYPGYEQDDVSYDSVHSDAEPVYWQATNISAFPNKVNSEKEAFARHFILRVKWEPGKLDNDMKETDIVYITVKATK